ncbi:NADH-quinone oxidoreductase subunit F [Buchnera aphidicola (Tetraneura ulmi)]|uniref:NADH-quinone oxidoreductase subunit NuoF n=1 Tax=Buchnera aphidicola TaxID=9 RepID=UPI003464A04C
MKDVIKKETHPLTWWIKNNKNNTIWIKEYVSTIGYLSFKKVLKSYSPKEVIKLIILSGLKGRGGAGFPTGIKWKLVSNQEKVFPHYLLCNADEMEPGTYKDRFLMEKIPHQLIEGILISAYAIGSSCGYIFLRGEYVDAERILKRAIEEAKNFGFLGKNILGTDFNFNLFLHSGAGRYICGEETALINSLEGRRATPRSKPPFPAVSGLWGKPTCINNVETLSNVPSIFLHGIDWYKNLSNSEDSGTKMMGFSGKVKNPGIWEVPLGITAREILEEYAGGMQYGYILKTWLPGGASTNFLIQKHLDMKMDFSSFMKIGSRLGTGMAMAVHQEINIVSLLKNLEIFFSRESCGWCTPCRDGLPWIVKILSSLEKKKGKLEDILLIEELCLYLGPGKTFCAHAPGAILPLKSALFYFRNEFEAGVKINK